MTGLGICADPNTRENARGVKQTADINDSNGPTILLNYNTADPPKTPTSSFMYFIPLISTTLVSTQISPQNHQQAVFTSYHKKVTRSSFILSCEFELHGSGFFMDIYEPNGIIATFSEEINENAPVKNVLDYIRLEGPGFGRMDVKGTITDSKETVTQVAVHFNTKDNTSPVTIGLYSVKPENGKYKYENRYDEIVAKVAVLTFKKTNSDPKMAIEVFSVNKASKPNSYIGRVKGFIVNFFIPPIAVSKIGNDAMLNFGNALLNKQTSFTFPKAVNLTSQTIAP
jgi:hypothetical protein